MTEKPQQPETIVIRQSVVFYLIIAVVFFIAGFFVAWITFTSVSSNTNARDIRSAAASGARDGIESAFPDFQGTMVAYTRNAVNAALEQGGISAEARATAVPPTPAAVDPGDSPSWGPTDALVTVVEYSDFECPYCRAFFRDTYPLFKTRYQNKVRFVFKHFPVAASHPDAEPAARASECAREQGKFWEFYDIAYAQDDLSRVSLIDYAKKAGVKNIDQFVACFDSGKYADRVEANRQEGRLLGIPGTPTFFINGYPLAGYQSFATLSAAIEDRLADARSRLNATQAATLAPTAAK